jgi:predicted nucleotidyltransferase
MSSNPKLQTSVSVRLPESTSGRLEAAAVARGKSVEDLVGDLVENFLAHDDRRGPDLAAVQSALRTNAESLRRRGVTGLWVFGSVARGDARAGSDVDLVAEFEPGARISLVALASLRAELSDLLGVPADVVERSSLRSSVLEAAEREGVRVL